MKGFPCINSLFSYNFIMSIQDEILYYLQIHPHGYAEEMSAALGKTRANIQHHLKRMEQQKWLVSFSIAEKNPVRGRPRKYYRLGLMPQSATTILLITALLSGISHLEDLPHQDQVIAWAAHHIFPHPKRSTTLTQSLNHLINELTLRGYQARWEARATGPEIVLRSCPYYPLPDTFPILCKIDRQIMQNVLRLPGLTQIARIQLPGVLYCRFANLPGQE